MSLPYNYFVWLCYVAAHIQVKAVKQSMLETLILIRIFPQVDETSRIEFKESSIGGNNYFR